MNVDEIDEDELAQAIAIALSTPGTGWLPTWEEAMLVGRIAAERVMADLKGPTE